VTHTQLFAAASSASSIGDFISNYNSYSHGGVSAQSSYDNGAHGPGTLWEKPEWYIQNSPVMSADKVSTPLLMFETTKDGACPFWNAMELYTALRRLGKKVWMLEYEDGNHAVYGKSGMDFDLRMQQFFNYYLKDAPPPKWMTEGVPAQRKGIETGLELDTGGTRP
jgi:dipeptidyl aminopeptidase/acylaminoacyl peptidase